MKIKIKTIEVTDYKAYNENKKVKSVIITNETRRFFREKFERGFFGERNDYFEDFVINIPERVAIGTVIEFNKETNIPENICFPVYFEGIANKAWVTIEIM